MLLTVNSFRYRLCAAGEMAKRNLTSAQGKMKTLFDRRPEYREFEVGDQVLALLPIVGSPFVARFMGPYKVSKKNLRTTTSLRHLIGRDQLNHVM